MDITIRTDDLHPLPCAAGIELLPGVVLAGSEDDILDALRKIADVLGPTGATVDYRDPGPSSEFRWTPTVGDRVLARLAFGLPPNRWV